MPSDNPDARERMCVFIFRRSGGIQCLAKATHGYYCAVHHALLNPPKPEAKAKARKKTDPGRLDRDLLPFNAQEFRALADLKDKTR